MGTMAYAGIGLSGKAKRARVPVSDVTEIKKLPANFRGEPGAA